MAAAASVSLKATATGLQSQQCCDTMYSCRLHRPQ